MHREGDKYYYYPTMTKNIMFVRGEKYVCMSNNINKNMKKYNSYTLYDFTNNNIFEDLIFIDENLLRIRVSPFDCGNFLSIKQLRKRKLEKLKKK